MTLEIITAAVAAAAAAFAAAKIIETRKNRETARLRAENAELKRLNDIKLKFMSIVAHDLKQPLTAAQGYAFALAEDEHDDIRRKMLGNITKAAVNMGFLINDLADAAALSSGHLSLTMRTFDYNQLMDDIYQQYKITADKKQINFSITEMPVSIMITADKPRVHQVISNMLNNAFKFTPPGGSVEIKYYTDGDLLRTSVRDSGQGMQNIDRAKIFEPFQQADFMPDEQRRLGRGLGMAIAYDIVKAHHGVIENDSAGPGRGSIFWFTIPLKQPPAMTA